MKKILLLSLVLTACAHPPFCPSPTEGEQPHSLREAFPKDKKAQSEALFDFLVRAGLPEQKTAETTKLTAYDFTCHNDSIAASRQVVCDFFAAPKNDLPNKHYQVADKDLAKVRDLLFSLPVSQGDSGAATEYVSCYQSVVSGKKETQCSVAIELDYSGP